MDEVTGPPDVYADQFTMAQSAYGLAITFAKSSTTPTIPGQAARGEPQVIVRMSLEHAKMMVMLLRKNLRQYELEHLGDPIRLPRALMEQQSLDEKDW